MAFCQMCGKEIPDYEVFQINGKSVCSGCVSAAQNNTSFESTQSAAEPSFSQPQSQFNAAPNSGVPYPNPAPAPAFNIKGFDKKIKTGTFWTKFLKVILLINLVLNILSSIVLAISSWVGVASGMRYSGESGLGVFLGFLAFIAVLIGGILISLIVNSVGIIFVDMAADVATTKNTVLEIEKKL